jgi:hypothetical protein
VHATLSTVDLLQDAAPQYREHVITIRDVSQRLMEVVNDALGTYFSIACSFTPFSHVSPRGCGPIDISRFEGSNQTSTSCSSEMPTDLSLFVFVLRWSVRARVRCGLDLKRLYVLSLILIAS